MTRMGPFLMLFNHLFLFYHHVAFNSFLSCLQLFRVLQFDSHTPRFFLQESWYKIHEAVQEQCARSLLKTYHTALFGLTCPLQDALHAPQNHITGFFTNSIAVFTALILITVDWDGAERCMRQKQRGAVRAKQGERKHSAPFGHALPSFRVVGPKQIAQAFYPPLR